MSKESAIAYWQKHKHDRDYLDAHNARRKAARKRKRGGIGPLKPLSMSEVMAEPDRGTKHICSECPVWKPSYCGITCATRIAAHPACKYGLIQINNERAKQWHRDHAKT